VVRGFRADEVALADLAGAVPPGEPETELAHGHVRLALPAAWFPARLDGATFTAFQLRTGHDDDVMALYLGDSPPFRPHPGREFRLALGPIAVRGTLWNEGPRQRMEALALLPCASPRYVQFSVHTDAPDRLARVLAALRSLRVERAPRTSAPEVIVSTPRDDAALAALTARDPLARDLAARALASDGLRAQYPLDTTHPLADQALTGRFRIEPAGVPTEVWLRIPVRAGRAEAPPAFRALTEGSFAREAAGIARAGCRAPSLVLAHDGVGLRCEGEPEFRAVAPDENDPAALPRALVQLLHARATLARWRREPAVAGGWPASLCETDRVRVVPDGGALYVSTDRCVLALDPGREAARAAAIEGNCAQVPVAPWSVALRAVGRFDEVQGTDPRSCRFSLGWNGRSAWVIAAGNGGTASAPIAQGPTVAADRRAVNTAAGFLHDLLRFATGEMAEPPPNVRPTVLHALGVDRPGTPAAAATLRLFHARGGFAGAALSAVLGVRTLNAEHVEVAFMPVVVELTQEPGGWVVTGVRPGAPTSP
jgi:hypothetical protein